MARVNITLPAMGEGITDATLTKFLVNINDEIVEDSVVAEVATDKVDSEITSPYSGKVVSFNCNEGDVVTVGSVIIVLESDSAAVDHIEIEEKTEVKKEFTTVAATGIEYQPVKEDDTNKRFLSPLVKQLVSEHEINEIELNKIQGSGINNRLTKEDVLDYVHNRTEKEPVHANPIQHIHYDDIEPKEMPLEKTISRQTVVTAPSADVEIIEMDRMRKLIAEHMVHSVHTSPHVTSFIEVDVTKLVEWRNQVKDEYLKKHGEKLTFMPVFIESAAMVINDFPQVNVSIEGNKILYKKNINIGIATALPTGNLIVPVIKNADQKNLIGLTKSLNDLANRARESKLLPDEIKGGTFTITNLGSFGTLTGTPIINQPESAILAIGQIRKMPAVIETPAGDAIAIRQRAIFSITYDHRIIDGALAGAFLKKICDTVENFDTSRKF